MTAKLYSTLRAGDVHKQNWVTFDATAIVEDEVEIVVQINGKVRDRLKVAVGLSKPELEKLAPTLPRVRELTAGKNIVKIIAVPNKLINIVVR